MILFVQGALKKARIGPMVNQIWLATVLHALSLVFDYLINATAFHWGRYEPSSLSAKELNDPSIRLPINLSFSFSATCLLFRSQ